MHIAIRILGIVFVVLAIVYFLKPEIIKWLIEFFKQGKRLYIAGIIRFVLAIVFLLAANQCNKPKVIGTFGVLFIISGLSVFIIRLEKLKAYIGWWQKQTELALRAISLVTLAIGILIIYSA